MLAELLVSTLVALPPPGLHSELRRPPSPHGTVLVVHGGGWLRTGADEVRYEAPRPSGSPTTAGEP